MVFVGVVKMDLGSYDFDGGFEVSGLVCDSMGILFFVIGETSMVFECLIL